MALLVSFGFDRNGQQRAGVSVRGGVGMAVTHADIQEPGLVEDMTGEIGLGIGRARPFMDLAEAVQVLAAAKLPPAAASAAANAAGFGS